MWKSVHTKELKIEKSNLKKHFEILQALKKISPPLDVYTEKNSSQNQKKNLVKTTQVLLF